MSAYKDLETRFGRIAAIEDTLGILDWDAQTMMPRGAIAGRSDQLAALKVLSHELMVDGRMADLIGEASGDEAGLDDWQRANLREMRRRHRRATAIPADLVEASSRAAAASQHAWETARPANDFAGVKPLLAEVIATRRAVAEALGDALGLSPYDALLDAFDLGSTAAEVDRLFAPLRKALPELIGAAVEAQAAKPALPIAGHFPIGRQEALGRKVLNGVGFDFDRGRLDVSAHPFTGGAFGDVRITTRYRDSDFFSALMGTIHEGGHAVYEQGRPQDWRGQPVGESRGMSVHESQSLSFEMQAARSIEFQRYLAPLARETFGVSGPEWTAENLHRIAIDVKPGFIRVEADEVTYPAHIMLRYGLEKAVIGGDLALDDLPAAFNDGVKSFLGLDVPDDRHGVLQDIHWYAGLWGYFPTYLVGAMTAAQLVAAARTADPETWPALERGDFGPLLRFMRPAIHARGSLLDRAELIEAASGEPLSGVPHHQHLRARYLG
ncbi:MAG: carboxypeptidase M32 [Bauldia sp.]|nr:carboxypeptidase M32 [Bauldia sp.]